MVTRTSNITNRLSRFLILATVVGVASLKIFAQQVESSQCEIKGRATDAAGRPLRNAEMTLVPINDSADLDRITYTAFLGSDGQFIVRFPCDRTASRFELYILPRKPRFINPPTSRYLKTNAEIFVRRVTIRMGSPIDMGRFVVKLPSAVAVVRLNVGDIPDPSNTWLVLFNSKGAPVEEETIDGVRDVAGYDTSGELEICIPSGKWRFKLCSDPSCERKVLAKSALIRFRKYKNVAVPLRY